ncbi:hypothetical protein CNBC6710 [Cryptococcus deneoformans B-3501A]|uniref:Dynactin 2 n=1 Tax=Cryptococcus deneoformans (strain JEC21 / ATCC MYA-565) TaxID=214684 RepID=Q5KL72_CRYD1|nr:hypothetical protein CNC00520 [Cryptococcus neoformans var. neoformans JEC21]XP_776282.1 hypothetical protein CNBC6710 [Cryptococcus neoformans var. neoformans B-3501A]AAW42035.1 hypothetical protein CNC00520 [Cryptococcus neoformans var. neoformans JEC21]EAL21635.1 hypothetical protein CNBC6710 [Cryptococcus neoformans var. neoformans B-3501A]
MQMATKYRGLPDIDTAPDIFETTDEPEIVLKPSDVRSGDEDSVLKPVSEDIDAGGLPSRRKAERVFARGTRKPELSTLSFRPRLPPLSRYASSSSDTDEEPPLPRETPAARLRRLKAELAEIEAEVGSSSPSKTQSISHEGSGAGKRRSVLPPRQPVDVVSELANVRERLERVEIDGLDVGQVVAVGMGPSSEWRERLDKLVTAENRSGKGKVAQSTAVGQQDSSLSDIDKRLAALEQVVGPTTDGLDQTLSPLVPTLNKHDHLLTLLTQPRHLDAISRRVKLLLVDLDRAAAASRRTGAGGAAIPQQSSEKAVTNLSLTQGEYTQLQSLFSVLPRLDPLLPILTPLLARLRSLSALHSEASEIAVSLRELQSRDKKNAEEINELDEVVKSVQTGLGDAIAAIKKNWEGLEKRMMGLEQRLKDMERQI